MDEYPAFDGVEPYDTVRSIDDERAHRKRMCAIGYRILAAQRWGQLGDGHVSARDPELTDHFWLLDWGVPFGEATVDRLVLVGPDGQVKDADGNLTGAVNTAGYNIHAPILAARPDAVSAAHTHTQFGTPWSANVEPFRAISQESCAFVFDQAMFDDEEVEVLSIDGGKRIAAAIGESKLCILRNHGLLTVGQSRRGRRRLVRDGRTRRRGPREGSGRQGRSATKPPASPHRPSRPNRPVGACSTGSSAASSRTPPSSTDVNRARRRRPRRRAPARSLRTRRGCVARAARSPRSRTPGRARPVRACGRGSPWSA